MMAWVNVFNDDFRDWYETTVYVSNPGNVLEKYNQIENWIKQNIPDHENCCVYLFNGNYTRVKFKHKNDYLWFMLVWK